MLEMSDGYKAAIVGDVRQMAIKALISIVDPDIQYEAVTGSQQAAFSKPEQLHDRTSSVDVYATLEPHRWVLDGSHKIIPNVAATIKGNIGFVGEALSGDDGVFSNPQIIEFNFRNVNILQACSIFFSDYSEDGIGKDFKVEILNNGQLLYTKEITGNTERQVSIVGFTTYEPDCIRVTFSKWSMAGRRVRVSEIIPGILEEWTDDVLASVDIQQHVNFSCLSIPYGTCSLKLDNFDRRFEPRDKSGVFNSLEEKQEIPISIGVYTDSGIDYKSVGVFYQYSGGWRTSNNDTTIQWDLVDIVGLISEREYIAPSVLPTTLGGWVKSIVSQLGKNFENKWHVDPNYQSKPCTVKYRKDVEGRPCGDILRYVCMATGTFPRADAETGYLTAEPFWNQGAKMDLDNMEKYPTMLANDDLAVLSFRLYDDTEEGTTYNISGNATASSNTISVDNPFIHTFEEAKIAARQILSQYGGLKIETLGRGNPASEMGDVDTIWLDESSATTGRRMDQSFCFSNGVLRDCSSTLLQADGNMMFSNRMEFDSNGIFHVPDGINQLRLILVGGGQGGERGENGKDNDGEISGQGKDGDDGSGGRIWSGVISVTPGIDYEVKIGVGGKASNAFGVAGERGTESKFGVHSSESGRVFPTGYTDIESGNSYGRSGVENPSKYGDGGIGGKGGAPSTFHKVQVYDKYGNPDGYDIERSTYPKEGKIGKDGANGVVVVYWEKAN